tara:strand:+ start:436 stop:648 length:213 start_codon:yes stop_codon:yes gene_type:complete
MSCTHTRTVPGRWVENPDHNPEEWALEGWDLGPELWEEGGEEGTYEDVDVHRYRCTQCGEIFYYSRPPSY